MNRKFVVGILLISFITGCSSTTKDIPSIDKKIVYDEKFGGSKIMTSTNELSENGFEFGDSVDILFENGFAIENVPYYSGYYAAFGEPLLVGYEGYDYIALTYNYIGGVFEKAGLNKDEDASVKIRLNKKAEFLNIQTSMSQEQSNNREDYTTDENFANYREITNSSNEKLLIYRSASATNNKYNRVNTVDNISKENNIQYIFDLEDSKEEMEEFAIDNSIEKEYWQSLYKQDRILTINMPVNYVKLECFELCADIIRFMLNHDGPYLFHCTQGKDRTGFLAIIIESLIGKSLEEIENDYMLTYKNYYKIDKTSSYETYISIKETYFDTCLKKICACEDINIITSELLQESIENKLIEAGLTQEEIDNFKNLY